MCVCVCVYICYYNQFHIARLLIYSQRGNESSLCSSTAHQIKEREGKKEGERETKRMSWQWVNVVGKKKGMELLICKRDESCCSMVQKAIIYFLFER
jgi:hypothetical protein